MRHRHAHFAAHHRGGRHRARRGAIVNGILTLLEERPMHGYELIREVESRSGGRWRPSPGSVYPALSKMEERGLLSSELVDGKKRFELTDAGRERLAAFRAERGDDDREPWDDPGTGHRGDLRRHVAEIVGQSRQIGRFGTAEQIRRAGEILADTTRRLYGVLAEAGTPDESDADESDADA